jgi:hypothetical protein
MQDAGSLIPGDAERDDPFYYRGIRTQASCILYPASCILHLESFVLY